jgi:hypothetical protein
MAELCFWLRWWFFVMVEVLRRCGGGVFGGTVVKKVKTEENDSIWSLSFPGRTKEKEFWHLTSGW